MIVLEKMVDLSPLYISLKTAIITIVITFFLGLFLAKWKLNRKHDLTKIILDGIFTMPLVLPPTVMGFFLLMIFIIKLLLVFQQQLLLLSLFLFL